MLFLYNLVVVLVSQLLKFVALFSPKMKLFVNGRKNVFTILQDKLQPSDDVIWFHAASLGEYEQGLPVIEKIKEKFPTYKIVVSFFSPSGYEVRKSNKIADVTIYLPLDTKKNAKKFVALVQPKMAFFIKYEFWPNYLNELKEQKIPTYLISGIFRKNQAFFKWYGGFYKKALSTFEHFFVQNENSKELIQSLSFQNVTVSGDTRFDRVVTILNSDTSLPFIETFINNKTTIVVGSSWPKDEDLLIQYINNAADDVKFIMAPHNIKEEQILNLKLKINKSTVLYSEFISLNQTELQLQNYNVFIIDTIGLLTKIYSYADIAYVGGGFGNPGVHNILEPATYGVPIVIGSNYSHFAEATALVNLGGCISINNQSELNNTFDLLLNNLDERNEKGHICETFVQINKGATDKIVSYIIRKNSL
ncbi:3-deoxy-D-manno-octulosonic acid transferase [Flavobacterium sp.]|uniref:3-deoxy-D-manno-octulosonic acid transferase n=1 Tax=Flavobacterium sp. TaxID=239 RepID=UPI003527FCF8